MTTENTIGDRKRRTSIYLKKDTEMLIRFIQEHEGYNSATTVIDEAIKFYYGYLTGSISQDYLCGTLGSKLEAVQNRGNDRIARLLYKLTTELNLNTKMIAADKQIPKDEYDRMRRKAMQEINGTRGIINLYDAGLDESIEKEGS